MPGSGVIAEPGLPAVTPGSGEIMICPVSVCHQELSNHVRKEIGPIAKPKAIMIVPELPKTRSGKIMRRLLRDVAEKRTVGDTTTLADSSIMELIAAGQAQSTED
jgi:acetyl-CoA synthetase